MEGYYMYNFVVHTMLCTIALHALLIPRSGRVNGEATGEAEELVKLPSGRANIVVKSPNYPDNYVDGEVKHWIVEGAKGRRVKITFQHFHTENTDPLLITEDAYPFVEAKYSGDQTFPPFVSFGNRINLTFRPDKSISKRGFNLSISHFIEGSNGFFHKALNSTEHIRILDRPICGDDWNMDAADTVCKEAGFPGAYESQFTRGSASDSGIRYQCSRLTYRLQDCVTSRLREVHDCNAELPVVKCNVVGLLGCFRLAHYSHLLKEHVNKERDQCVAHCRDHASTPQYAIHYNGTYCSCVSQTSLNIRNITRDSDRCRTDVGSRYMYLFWATIFNASFGFCGEPALLPNGYWKKSSDGYMHGTTITATCNEGYELVSGDEMLKCGKATHDFDWQGLKPSCRERITGSRERESLPGSVSLTSVTPQNSSKLNEMDGSASPGTSIAIALSISVAFSICFIIVFTIISRIKNSGDLMCGLWRYQTKHYIQGGRPRVTQNPEESSRIHSVLDGVSSVGRENEYVYSVDVVTACSIVISPASPPTNTAIHHPISPDIPSIQDHSNVSRTPSTEPSLLPVVRVEDVIRGDLAHSEMPINSSTSTLPSTQINLRPTTSECPANLRPLPLRPISPDRTYAEPGNRCDRANPCQPSYREHNYQDPESTEHADIDVSVKAVRLAGQDMKSPVTTSGSLLQRRILTLPNTSSDVAGLHPYQDPLTTADCNASFPTVRIPPKQDVVLDSTTPLVSQISDGQDSTSNHDKRDYEDIPRDRSTPKPMTLNSKNSGVSRSGDGFHTKMRQTQRSSSCSEKKYCSIHEHQPQNESEEVQTHQDHTVIVKATSSNDHLYFTLERESEYTTEMLDNPLYQSTEPYL